ncbi:MAG: hypothetical protein MRJ92_01475 [Nitrospira sp.]|nr:hypothetical protein [Nitrospira sp.]
MLVAYLTHRSRGPVVYDHGFGAGRAQGIRDALDVLIGKGRLPKDEDVKVIVLGGDGSTYDMALSSTSGAMNRKLGIFIDSLRQRSGTATPACSSPRHPLPRERDTFFAVCSIPPRRSRRRKTSLRSGGRIGRPTSRRSPRGIR